MYVESSKQTIQTESPRKMLPLGLLAITMTIFLCLLGGRDNRISTVTPNTQSALPTTVFTWITATPFPQGTNNAFRK